MAVNGTANRRPAVTAGTRKGRWGRIHPPHCGRLSPRKPVARLPLGQGQPVPGGHGEVAVDGGGCAGQPGMVVAVEHRGTALGRAAVHLDQRVVAVRWPPFPPAFDAYCSPRCPIPE